MYLKVLACDLDNTLAENGIIADDTWLALKKARKAGFTLILVTGRKLDSFAAGGPFAEYFEAIVAEDGAAIYYPRNDTVSLPFGHLSPDLIRRLSDLNIPLDRGIAIAATWVPHDEIILEILRDMGGGATVEYNRGAVMILPPGATKGTGLSMALQELGFSTRNVIACGDAENDRSLFELAELSVAVANAVPEIKKLADIDLTEKNGEGVRNLIDNLVAGNLPVHQSRFERQLILGQKPNEEPVYINPFELLSSNMGFVGASSSGKSWLAGLLAEELLKHGYQVCIVDPEGDYRGLKAFPRTLLLGGGGTELPPVEDVITISEYTSISLILDLSMHPVEKRTEYVEQLMHSLCGLRARRGRPHWFLIDEIHTFCPYEGSKLTDFMISNMSQGGFGVVSYQPSRVAPKLLDALNRWIITRMTNENDIYVVKNQLSKVVCENLKWGQLSKQTVGQAYLCMGRENPDSMLEHGLIEFKVARRVVPHVRHLHKYLRVPLPESKRFYFKVENHGLPQYAASLWEFREALAELPVRTLRYHLDRGDFYRWVNDIIHDRELARRLRKLTHRPLKDDELRNALSETVSDRYLELESLI